MSHISSNDGADLHLQNNKWNITLDNDSVSSNEFQVVATEYPNDNMTPGKRINVSEQQRALFKK